MKISDNEKIQALLTNLNDWKLNEDGHLQKEWMFDSFIEAFGFMTKVALLAEKQNHHPNWYNAFKKLRIVLFTHDVCGLSDLDFKLAKSIDGIEIS